VERVLAIGRAVLATSALLAVYFDPTEPTLYAGFAYGLLVAYVILSFVILIRLRWEPKVGLALPLVVHGTDVLWATAITLLTEGPSSPFFVFFVFVLLAAAYRWGLQETLATAALSVLLLVGEVVLGTSGGPVAFVVQGEFELNRIIMRATYLLLVGFLLGFLAEEEKQLRAETLAIARLVGMAQVQAGLKGTLQAVLQEFLRLFEAQRVLLAVEDTATGRAFLWDGQRAPDGRSCTLRLVEIDPSQRQTFFLAPAGQGWQAVHRLSPGQGDPLQAQVFDSLGSRLHPLSAVIPESFLSAFTFRSLLVLPLHLGEEWAGRLFLLDPALQGRGEAELRFLRTLVQHLAPAIYNVYLLRRLRTRAGAIERARVARELHDGAIQSLLAIELQLEALRRQTEAGPARVGAELARLQELLRQEVANLRELMQQLQPPDLTPQQLLEFMADTVEKFRRETGIAAQFVSNVEEVALAPRVCRELARILQEALVNVRKHSGATNVLVRFVAHDGRWMLEVDDNGRGFDFSGRLDHAELEAARKGPLVIKERARSIGAEVAVESDPGRGARLEIIVPPRSHG